MVERYWSRKIATILCEFAKSPHLTLFGITGDIDNLGIYVSRKGRPLAENLVDVYNRIIGFSLLDYIEKNKHDFLAFCIVPSGEEVFAIGLCRTVDAAQKMFGYINKELNATIQKSSPISDPDVTVSFGCDLLDDTVKIADIRKFIRFANAKHMVAASRIYLDIMLKFREKLAKSLDFQKFGSLGAKESGLTMLYRNIVYLQLQIYKKTTRNALIGVSQVVSDDQDLLNEALKSLANTSYGLDNVSVPFLEYLLRKQQDHP